MATPPALLAAAAALALALRAGARLLPMDSEHNAIFQALGGADPSTIEQMILTASGGPFRTWTAEAIAAATPQQALAHPNWSMGPKVTIDSASLMNKGLELIEAFHIFGIEAGRLKLTCHFPISMPGSGGRLGRLSPVAGPQFPGNRGPCPALAVRMACALQRAGPGSGPSPKAAMCCAAHWASAPCRTCPPPPGGPPRRRHGRQWRRARKQATSRPLQCDCTFRRLPGSGLDAAASEGARPARLALPPAHPGGHSAPQGRWPRRAQKGTVTAACASST